MVRSMYSGVSGMKVHQTKMDAIGNNIANVNTYGYKAGRVSFQDVYYQTMTGASGGTQVKGGTNPSQIGYGSKVGGIDILQTRSTFQMTDNGMDLAIAGEGFFQVQDTDGNKFYTRAGMLRFDVAGNLVDPNGNFVLGVTGDPLGKSPSSNKIQLKIPNVDPKAAGLVDSVNSRELTISASEKTKFSNVALNFVAEKVADGQAFAIGKTDIGSNSITVRVSESFDFNNMDQFNELMNLAITEANGGKAHPAGNFTVAIDGADPFANNTTLTGGEIVGDNFDIKAGKLTLVPDAALGPNGATDDPTIQIDRYGIGFDSVSTNPAFSVTGPLTFDPMTYRAADPAATPPVKEGWTITAKGGTPAQTFTGTVTSRKAGKVELVSASGEKIIMTHKGVDSINSMRTNGVGGVAGDATPLLDGAALGVATVFTAAASLPSRELGLGGNSRVLTGGTEGGPQTAADLSSISIGPDGTIEAVHADIGRLALGRIDLVNFENPQGLSATGNSYFSETSNSGKAKAGTPGSGGAGALAAGSLEMSNVDLSREFSDMIVTQRGFQANSRIITVSDEMLNELVNLKR